MLYIKRSKDTKDEPIYDSRYPLSNNIFNVCIQENPEGIIIDVSDGLSGELINTSTYWNDDYE